MKGNIKTILGIILITIFMSGCGSTRTVYKPVSYKEPEMSYSDAVEYCTHYAETKADEFYERARANSQARAMDKWKTEMQYRAATNSNPSYTSNVDCTAKNNYSYYSSYNSVNVNCKGVHRANSGYTPSFLLNKPTGGEGAFWDLVEKSGKKSKAFKNCMFDKGYKQVTVHKNSVANKPTKAYSKPKETVTNNASSDSVTKSNDKFTKTVLEKVNAIKDLNSLFKKGVITSEEFDRMKKDLLSN